MPSCFEFPRSLVALALLFLADVAASIALNVLTLPKHKTLIADLANLGRFSDSGLDCVLLALCRLLLLPLFAAVAVRLGSVSESSAEDQPAPVPKSVGSINSGGSVAERQPLLGGFAQSDVDHVALIKREADKKKKAAVAKQRADRARNWVIGFMYVFVTAASAYIGIKTVSFNFEAKHSVQLLQACLMAAGILCGNVEYFMLKRFIELMTKETGYLVPGLHNHKLYYHPTIPCHWCDVCHDQIKAAGYRCKNCDFDVCEGCFRAGDKARTRGEGIVRGDKGTKQELDLTSGAYMHRAIKIAMPQWHLMVIAVGCLLVNAGSALVVPNYQGEIFDFLIKDDKHGFTDIMRDYLSVNVAQALFGAVSGICFSLIGRRIANSVRNKLFRSIMVQDMAFFDGWKTGQLTSRLTQETSAMVSPITNSISTLAYNAVVLVGALGALLVTSWRLSILAFTSVGPTLYVTALYASWSRSISMEIWGALSEANSVATEALTNVRTVRAFSTESDEITNYMRSTGHALAKGVKDAWASAGSQAFTSYVDLGAGVLILWYGGLVTLQHPSTPPPPPSNGTNYTFGFGAEDVTSGAGTDFGGALTIGKLITFQLYWTMLKSAIQNLNGILNSFTRAAGAAQRVFELIDNMPDIDPNAGQLVCSEVEGAGDEKLPKITGQITLKDVRFTYQMRPDAEILKGINLEIKGDSVVALVGKSGGGKSTLIHLLLRFYDPASGTISMNGLPLPDYNLSSLHARVGVVAQETQLFASTVAENISYGCKRAFTNADIVHAAKMANAHEFICKFEEGYATKVGERGVRLSGGQKQRIAIARCMLRKPRLLLLDEATSNLDSQSEALVQDAIDKLIGQGGCTVVLVAHRLSTVINANKIAVLDNGSIVEQGTHRELIDLDGHYAALVARQLEKYANTLDEEAPEPEPDQQS